MKESIQKALESIVDELNAEHDTAWELFADPDGASFDVETWSDAGEDVIISLSGRTLAELASDARAAADEFDAEEHAAHIFVAKRDGSEDERRFYADAPDTLHELLEDAEQIQRIYNALAELLERRAN